MPKTGAFGFQFFFSFWRAHRRLCQAGGQAIATSPRGGRASLAVGFPL